jgi:chaperone required for assembly of F1-ATPase
VSGSDQKTPRKPPAPETPKIPGREALRPPLPKRFYKDVMVEPGEGGFAVLLDGRPVRTPKKLQLVLPTRALADAIAEEWAAQKAHIDPATMPLSRLAITALDGVAGNAAVVAADIVKFAGSDLLCYRAESPETLQRLQAEAWDPVLRWADDALGARFVLAAGVMPVTQSQEALDRVAAAVAPFSAMALTCVHVMTTLTGSALLALARARGALAAEAAWAAAHVDEDWQISQWGVDVEAAARREQRHQEMMAASRFLELLDAD